MKEYQNFHQKSISKAPTRTPTGGYIVGAADILPPIDQSLFITDQGVDLCLTRLRCDCFEVAVLEPMGEEEGGQR